MADTWTCLESHEVASEYRATHGSRRPASVNASWQIAQPGTWQPRPCRKVSRLNLGQRLVLLAGLAGVMEQSCSPSSGLGG
jgi:hypothetical protein